MTSRCDSLAVTPVGDLRLTLQLLAATVHAMPRRSDRKPPDPATDPRARDDGADAEDVATDADSTDRPDLSAIPVGGLTPRRLAGAVGALVVAWIVVTFARQAGAAAEAAARADELRLANVQSAAELADLEAELRFIQRRAYIEIEMRGYRLGRAREIPFTLAPGAPPLGPGAPGSAAARLGEQGPDVTPLESWLSLLFGPRR
jgi:hypothetical protein